MDPFFFCNHEGHILFEELPLKREGKRVSVLILEALVCFMNDDIQHDTPDKNGHTFRQKSQT